MALPRAGYTKDWVHIKLHKDWILRAFKELMGVEVPTKFEDAFLELFKDALIDKAVTVELLKEIFSDIKEESIIFKYRGE